MMSVPIASHHRLHLAGLEIAAVILDRELDPGVGDAVADSAEGLDHVVDVHLDLRPLGIAAEDAAHALRAEDLRGLQRPRDLIFERPVLRVERLGARTDGAEGQLELDAEPIRMIPDLLDGGFIGERRGRQRHHRPRELDRAQVVEELDGRELVAANAAINRSELDASGALRSQQPGAVKDSSDGTQHELPAIYSGLTLHDEGIVCL
jgi:hypothetical protein